MKRATFFVTDGIPGIAAKDEVIKLYDNGILIGRWLPISKFPELMQNLDSLRAASEDEYSPPTRLPRRRWKLW